MSKRENISPKIKELIRWSQKDKCMLCDFPLVFQCHLHHIIPHSKSGPDHYYNLVGLCPNHHGMIEVLKRSKRTLPLNITTKKSRLFFYKNSEALKQFNRLDETARDICNLLMEQFGDLGFKTISEIDPNIHLALAQKLIRKDSEILSKINNHRPRIHYLPSDSDMKNNDVFDISYISDESKQKTIDEAISSKGLRIDHNIYDVAILCHLLGLGYKGRLNNENEPELQISKGQSFPIHKIKQLNNSELFGNR